MERSVIDRPSEASGVEGQSSGLTGALVLDEATVRGHLDEVVRSTVEQTLNGLLDAEADRVCNAKRYERSPDRQDTRAGHYQRKLQTKAGEASSVNDEAIAPLRCSCKELFLR
jgi:hypothetical protein